MEAEGSHFCGLLRAKEITAVVETQGKARNSVTISKCGSLEVTEGLSHHTVSFHIVGTIEYMCQALGTQR